MAKILKQTRLESDLIDEITKIAETGYDGNFTAAVESLLEQSISMRSLPEQVRWQMYSGAKRLGALSDLEEREYVSMLGKMTDSLYI
jgi:DNA polymerase III delta prime subunit